MSRTNTGLVFPGLEGAVFTDPGPGSVLNADQAHRHWSETSTWMTSPPSNFCSSLCSLSLFFFLSLFLSFSPSLSLSLYLSVSVCVYLWGAGGERAGCSPIVGVTECKTLHAQLRGSDLCFTLQVSNYVRLTSMRPLFHWCCT